MKSAQKFTGYKCSLCGKRYAPGDVKYTCPDDGGNLDVQLPFDQIRENVKVEDITSSNLASLWRYLPLLPVGDPGYEGTPIHSAGWTPVYSPPLLKDTLKMNLWKRKQ